MKENLQIDMAERALNVGESNQPSMKCPRIAQNLYSFGDLLTAGTIHRISQASEVLVRDIKSLATSDGCAETRERRVGRVTAGDLFDIAEPIPAARVRSVESMLLMEIAGMREN